MFSIQHIIWLIISIILIILVTIYLYKTKPELNKVLTVMCVLGVISECIKIFSSIEMVPSFDGTRYYPYMQLSQLPLHLCSMQIILILYTRFTKDSRRRELVLAFMYPTCLMGAFMALLMPSVFTVSIPPSLAFLRPIGYQYFLYHSALVILGLYIPLSGQVKLKGSHYFTTMGILGFLAVISLYLNSLFATAVYEDGVLVSVEYTTNFLYTYQTPIGIQLTALWQWALYLVLLSLTAIVLVGVCYLPYLKRDYFSKRKQPEGKIEKTENE